MIYGERIRFRAPERSDLPMFVRWISEPEVRRGVDLYRPYSLANEEGWFEAMLKRPMEEQPFVIEVRHNGSEGDETWTPIGNTSLFGIDWHCRSAEFGIMVGEKRYWDQGYGTEAVRLIVKYGFKTLNMHRIWLRVYETNPRAIRAYEKAGFKLEGRYRQGKYQEGAYVDVLLMSILRPEWQEQEQAPGAG